MLPLVASGEGLSVGVMPFKTPEGRCLSAVETRQRTIEVLDAEGGFASAEGVASRKQAQSVDVVVTVEADLGGMSMRPWVSAVTRDGKELFRGQAASHMNAKCGMDGTLIARYIAESLAEGTDARRIAVEEAAARPQAAAPAPGTAVTASNIEAVLLAAAMKARANAAAAAAPPAALTAVPAATAPAAREPSSDADAPSYNTPADEKKFAVIMGVERYEGLPEARFAERDARAMKAHALALGFPERNVVLLTGAQATRTGLVKNVETWLARNVSEGSTVLFYFSGHGAPDAVSGQAYLVPSDGDPAYLEDTGYPLKRLYEKLGALKAKRVLVALDACFSGAGGRSVLPRGARPLVSKVSVGDLSGTKLVALSASGAAQISGTLEEQGHGLFTYYLLKGLNGAARDGKGAVTAGSLLAYMKPLVEDAARRSNREQTPTLQGGAGAGELRLR